MLFKRVLLLIMVLAPLTLNVGCGPKTSGVADAPEEPTPELTPAEEAVEKGYSKKEQ
jgi:hypothetical protein